MIHIITSIGPRNFERKGNRSSFPFLCTFIKYCGHAQWKFISKGHTGNKWNQIVALQSQFSDFADPKKITWQVPEHLSGHMWSIYIRIPFIIYKLCGQLAKRVGKLAFTSYKITFRKSTVSCQIKGFSKMNISRFSWPKKYPDKKEQS